MSTDGQKRGGVENHLSLAEAAERMGISERTARRWIKSGKLRAYKPGRDYWIPESALTDLVEESEVHPKASASSQPSLNGLLEEEQRTLWEAAVEDARDLREGGQARMAELLSTWRASRERHEDPDARRDCRDEMGALLKKAWDAATELVRNYTLERNWEEVRDADRFYYFLRGMVEGQQGLFVRVDSEWNAFEIVEDAA